MYKLKNELTSKKYVEVTDLELEYPPESVLIYLRNNTEQDIRMSIEFLDINIQTPLINQNPTLVIEDSGEATVCLSPADESYETLICDGAVNFVDIHEYVNIGDLIDPHNTELYDYTGREFDDTSTNEDYAIFFAQAEFCLAPVIEDSCDGATNSTGCIQLEGIWDLEINGEIVLTDATPEQIEEYAGTLQGSLAVAERCCDMGYFRSISLQTVLHNVQNGDTVYVPVALTPDGPSITSPITIAADNNDWYSIGRNYSLQLDAQLRPYGLTSDWTNNFKEFGVTYYNVQQTKNEVKKFYILEEGNTVSPLMLPRGLPPLECFFPS